MKHIRTLVTLLLAFMMAFALCVTPATAESARTDLNVNLWAEPSALCAGFAASSSVSFVSRQIFDTLLISEVDGSFSPCLATAYEFQNDNKDLLFTLRDDVVFHNGEKMTAEDVAFSYNTIINAGYADTATSAMDNMEVVDDTHVVLHFDAEYGPALACVAQDYMVVFPKAYYESDPDAFPRNPIGTGAYKFVDWKTGDKISLTANEDYWAGAPSIKDVNVKIFTDNSIATLALENGELDVHTMPPQSDLSNIKANENLQYSEVLGNSTAWVIFNFESIFADENLRLAVAHAIDKEGVMLGAIEGNGSIAQAIYAPFTPGYDADYVGPEYNPELAKEYLAKAGYPDGLTLTVRANSSANYSKPLEIVQAYLSDVGIDIQIEKMEASAWFEDVFMGAGYDMNVVCFTMGMADFEELYALYRGGQSQNFGKMDDPDVNAAYDINHFSVDPAERAEACATIQHVMGDRALTIPLYTMMNGVAANKDLKGIQAKPMKDYRIAEWSWN